ncbi:hypothetical protein SMC26_32930 [Actinomadura fulvescens]|uniref:Uncharacterized protein n=1 Tax=Actinomadura fulvescens TaxID=46160 RepID=A0ABN3QBJ7_9ACTN
MTNVAEIKDQLRREFPDWSIITSSAGRWWATRAPDPGELVQHGASCFEADGPDDLYAQLAGVSASE